MLTKTVRRDPKYTDKLDQFKYEKNRKKVPVFFKSMKSDNQTKKEEQDQKPV